MSEAKSGTYVTNGRFPDFASLIRGYALRQLGRDFDDIAVPKHGRYTPAGVRG